MQQNTPRGHNSEQEPCGHRRRNTTQPAGTPVNRSQVAKDTSHTAKHAGTPLSGSQVAEDTARTTQYTEQATPVNRSRVAKDAAHTARRACTPVNRSQEAKDTGHARQHTERAHWGIGAKGPRAPHTQHTERYTDSKEPSGQRHRTHNTTDRAGTPVNRSQVATETARATQHTQRAHW